MKLTIMVMFCYLLCSITWHEVALRVDGCIAAGNVRSNWAYKVASIDDIAGGTQCFPQG